MLKTAHKQPGNLAARAGWVLVAITLGISIGSAGQANATDCASLAARIEAHNQTSEVPRSSGDLAAYNAEAEGLNAENRACGF